MGISQTIRPKNLLAPPVKLDAAFENPDEVLDLFKKGSPYKTLAAVHRNVGETSAGWFRNFWALGGKVVMPGAEPFFNNERFMEAAKIAFQAEVIRPVAMMTNLNLPAPSSPCHQDLPFFRGVTNREVPSWMLAPMGYSGLFHDWAIPVASAITWFYDGEGGDFEYWPNGLDKPSITERPPFSNTCVLADNEYMYHRVGGVGSPAEYSHYENIGYDATLELSKENRWQVMESGKDIADFAFDKVRLSVLWKAYCFETAEMAESYDNHSYDLDTKMIADIFCDDLRGRGIDCVRPTDFATDKQWKETITTVYAAATAD
ncbi:hypothetical protein NBZ79_00780 [Sneathiella marina]|uniref:Uncharacterized protein n=1 Tax=Sneathiella marina TaxID=2950108 RepID=A0ABY4W6Y6_9PROT|nr:hypothetical protein [Sneathiella marina]USG61510.1 hypothetical protein NBZ79_00780 [Sneathiella marina]